MTPKVQGRSSDKGAVTMNDNSQKALGLFSNLQRHSGLNNQWQQSVQELHNRATARQMSILQWTARNDDSIDQGANWARQDLSRQRSRWLNSVSIRPRSRWLNRTSTNGEQTAQPHEDRIRNDGDKLGEVQHEYWVKGLSDPFTTVLEMIEGWQLRPKHKGDLKVGDAPFLVSLE
jgi:hypothetical protein